MTAGSRASGTVVRGASTTIARPPLRKASGGVCHKRTTWYANGKYGGFQAGEPPFGQAPALAPVPSRPVGGDLLADGDGGGPVLGPPVDIGLELGDGQFGQQE